MLSRRIIPCLLLKNTGLVKTVQFKNPTYIGDPINAVKIFNEKEVDEIIFLDITKTLENKAPNFELLEKIANECFIPFCYGGGVRDIATMKRIFKLGAEKVCVNTAAYENPELIAEAARMFGRQAIVASMDVGANFLGKYEVRVQCGKKKVSSDPIAYAREMQRLGAGELFVNSINRDGMMQGYDLNLLKQIADCVNIPVIGCGGAGSLSHVAEAFQNTNVSGLAAGSLFVFYGNQKGVLITYPDRKDIKGILQ